MEDSVNPGMSDEIIAMIEFSGSPWLKELLRSLCRKFVEILCTSVWSLSYPWSSKSIERSGRCNATTFHIPLKSKQPSACRYKDCWGKASSRNQRQATQDVVQLNVAARGLAYSKHYNENHYTAWYHQTPLDPASLHSLYQWTRVAMRLKGAGSYFLRSMQKKVLTFYDICEIHIDVYTAEQPLSFLNPRLKPIHLTRELFPRSCVEHDRLGETLSSYDTSWQLPEDRQAQDSKILQQELHFLEGNIHFILKTDQINLTYLTVLLTGKVERRKLYLQDKNFYFFP